MNEIPDLAVGNGACKGINKGAAAGEVHAKRDD